MASRNEQGQIGIPTLGVRKDVNELVSTSDMAIDASNVIVFDSTVRPRPAHSREGFGAEATLWQEVFAETELDVVVECVTFFDIYLVAIVSNSVTQQRWIKYSNNGGNVWVDDFVSTVPPYDSQRFCVKMIPVAGRIVLFENWDHYPYQTGRAYAASIGTYPSTPLVFSTLFGGPPDQDVNSVVIPKNPRKIMYDEDNDVLYVQKEFQRGGFYNAPPVDPSLGWVPYQSITFLGTSALAAEGFQLYKWNNFSTITDVADIVQMSVMSGFKTYSYGGFRERILGFQGGLRWSFQTYEFWSNPNGRPEFGTNTLASNRNYLVGKDVNGVTQRTAHVPDLGVRIDLNSRQPVALYENDADSVYVLWTNGLQLVDLTDTSVAWYNQPYAQLDPAVPPIGPSPDKRLDIYHRGSGPGPGTKKLFTGMVETFTIVESIPPAADVLEDWDDFPLDTGSWRVAELLFNDNIGDGAWYLVAQNQPFWRWNVIIVPLECRIFLAPGGAAPVGFEDSAQSGDVTSIFQSNLDSQDNAVIVGTTRKVLNLNRATQLWDELTGEAITVAPPSPNTRMTGVWGLHPVIFRIFESGSNRGDSRTWLLSTNGVDHPMVWTEEIPNGKMRFMGQILSMNDPGYIDTDSEPYGVSAPIARTMAVASNRVLLGNLPAVSSYAVDVSAYNDMDRGWGRVQRTLIGDTPGEIVSLNEISALQVAIYKTDAIYSAVAQVDFVNTQAPFRFELVKAGVPGPCSPLSILRMHTGEQAYLGRDGGVYVYDGVAPRDVGRNVRRMIQPFLDTNEIGKAWGMVDNARKLLWFFFPTKSQNINRGVVMSTDQGLPFPVWPIQMPAGWQMTAGARCFFVTDTAIGEIQDSLVSQDPKTLGDYQTGREEMCIGRINNSWYTQKWDDDGNYTDDGIPIECSLITGWNPLGSLIQFKTVHELYHLFKCEGDELTVNMTVAAHQADTTVLLSGPENLSNGSIQLRTNHRATGTRFSLQLSCNARRLFNWGGATATYAPRGMR